MAADDLGHLLEVLQEELESGTLDELFDAYDDDDDDDDGNEGIGMEEVNERLCF